MKFFLFAVVVAASLVLAGCGPDAPSKEWFKSHHKEAMATIAKCENANYWTDHAKRCANAKGSLADKARSKGDRYTGSSSNHDFTPESYGKKPLTKQLK